MIAGQRGVTSRQMEKSMHKAELDRPKGRRGSDKGDLLLKEGLDILAEELVEVAEEIERVSTESSTLEDIEGCKVLARVFWKSTQPCKSDSPNGTGCS
ncbi:MAG: hypothetical protein HY203_08300 [Nitrospirae bacterium]|nr:hypothetical protein [Nitrospirota bacterium]